MFFFVGLTSMLKRDACFDCLMIEKIQIAWKERIQKHENEFQIKIKLLIDKKLVKPIEKTFWTFCVVEGGSKPKDLLKAKIIGSIHLRFSLNLHNSLKCYKPRYF